MSTELRHLSEYNSDLMPDPQVVASQKYAVVVADWNPEITNALCNGAVKTLKENGVREKNITIIHVPGTFELTHAASKLSLKMVQRVGDEGVNKYASVITLGCVIKGETPHFDYVCLGVTQGITEVNLMPNACPVVFGVLTTNNLQQAKDRADGLHGNKGVDAAITAIKMANLVW